MDAHLSRSLALQAYDGWDIPNSIDLGASDTYREHAMRAHRLSLAAATILGQPTGRYNCHGLVFASRRTNIPPPAMDVDIAELLHHDGYIQIPLLQPQIGDIAVYRGENEIEHTGFVSRIETLGVTPIVFVWSKWGDLHECEHQVNSCPYSDCQVEYWRLQV